MINIELKTDQTEKFADAQIVSELNAKIESVFEKIYSKSGAGSDFLGWTTLPSEIDDDFINDIKKTAATLRAKSQIFVVIGIGGSYLGARAVIEALGNHFAPYMNEGTQVVYAGNNISEDYLHDLLGLLDKKDYSVAVISKSGTTTEPAIAFRIIKEHLEKKYGHDEACSRIVAITDKAKGALKTMSDFNGYKTYVVPDDIGGRYSVLTPVGLLPIAVAGFDIKKLVEGARNMQDYCAKNRNNTNPVARYAVVRNALYRQGKTTEIMVNYEPRMFYFAEWWKQLYGESEGKENKGIFPSAVGFTTDLHSLGQYIQEGKRNLFETVLSFGKPKNELRIPKAEGDLDQLNYIAGRRIGEVNSTAQLATIMAHVDGGVPNIRLVLPEISETVVGELIYFFEMACAVSGYLLEVNPFDQPGVEAYKKNMFALLGKKGYEARTAELNKRVAEM